MFWVSYVRKYIREQVRHKNSSSSWKSKKWPNNFKNKSTPLVDLTSWSYNYQQHQNYTICGHENNRCIIHSVQEIIHSTHSHTQSGEKGHVTGCLTGKEDSLVYHCIFFWLSAEGQKSDFWQMYSWASVDDGLLTLSFTAHTTSPSCSVLDISATFFCHDCKVISGPCLCVPAVSVRVKGTM